jgi:hypothetical protein
LERALPAGQHTHVPKKRARPEAQERVASNGAP